MEIRKEELVKSPVNYIGNKFKLLPQILDLFPSNVSMLYDIFGGGGSISFNCKANHVYYNDIVNYMGDMFSELKGEDSETALNKIHKIINDYKLSKTNLDGFLKLRDFYNNGNKSWDIFYMLMCYSFNSQYRFNNKKEYNSSFGKHKSCFSNITEDKFYKFMNKLKNTDIVFDSLDFRKVDYSDADENDLVYFDPPYLISVGNYNDGKRGFSGWNKQDDIDLMYLCDKLNSQGTRFAMSNVLYHKGLTNNELVEWSKKYNVYDLSISYNNCNYQLKNKDGESREVLITNY